MPRMMMKRHLTAKRLFFVWIALAFVLAWGSSAHAEVRVAVASNFLAPAKVLAQRFSTLSGEKVVVSAGSTGKLYAQIKNGAPFDVFLAANAREPGRLEGEGATVYGTRFTYAQGRLALWCPKAPSSQSARACLDADAPGRIAIANPRLAPYGQAAVSVLNALDPAKNHRGRMVTGENIAQTFQMVWSGSAPVGFVALSQVKSHQDIKGAYWVVPGDLHAAIEQQAVLLDRAADNPAARNFLAFMQSPQARALIADFGYGTDAQLAERARVVAKEAR